jgi:hypothetical protein
MYAPAETCARRVPPATSRRAAAMDGRTALPGAAGRGPRRGGTGEGLAGPQPELGRRRATQPWPRCAGVVWQSACSCYFHALGKRKGSASAVATRPLRSWVVLTSCAHASICTLSGSPCILSAAPSRPSSRAAAGLVDIDAKPGREARDTVEHLGELSI